MTQPRMPEVGPVGRNLIVNVDRLRAERGMSWRKPSAELEKAGRAIPPLSLSRFLKGERRVDPDEVVAFAAVLKVTPDILMSPPDAAAAAQAEVPAAVREARNLVTRLEQLLAADGDPALPARQVGRALRRVQIEIEELLEEALGAREGDQVTALPREVRKELASLRTTWRVWARGSPHLDFG